jgi:hypothetical protein
VAVDIPGGPAGELGRSADALAAFQAVIDRYGDDPAPAPALRARVERATTSSSDIRGRREI